ncbi:MAG: ABC transporter substrate-binding protein [Chloroflexota bacterium]|nr:ABC transporter substrate-binding protein [Chloroflexota bacterium]
MIGAASRVTLQLPRRRRDVLGAGVAGLTSLGLVSGCGAGGASTSPAAGGSPASQPPQADASAATAAGTPAPRAAVQQASLRLSWIKNTEFAGFFAAQDRGYYRDEGIDLTINGAAQNLSEVQAVASKADTIGLSGGLSLLLARAQGLPVKAFGALFQRGPGCFLWLSRSGIKGIQDFKGKKIGIQQTARASTEAMLTMNNLSVEDVSLITVGFDLQPLLTGQVDVLTGLVTNQVVLLEQQGEQVGYTPYADLGFTFYWNTPFVLEDTLRERKDLLTAWLRASARGWDYALQNPDEVAKLVVEKYGEGLDLTNQTLELKRETPLIRSELTAQKGLFWMDPAVWRTGQDILLNRTRQLDKPVLAEDVATLEILTRVGKIGG